VATGSYEVTVARLVGARGGHGTGRQIHSQGTRPVDVRVRPRRDRRAENHRSRRSPASRARDAPAPYLLVAHSLGGVFARRLAQRFPDEVAGMLLVEAFHEDWDAHMPPELRVQRRDRQAMPAELPQELVSQLRGVYEQKLADWPPELRELLIDRHLDPEWLRIDALENSNLAELADELRHGGKVPDMPLIVLTALAPDPGQRLLISERQLRELSDRKRAFYAAVAESVPGGQDRVLEDAAPSSVHVDRPDAVVQAIRDLLDRVDR
jgi:pimeloyl-ACP methyl ester carboxylesterase